MTAKKDKDYKNHKHGSGKDTPPGPVTDANATQTPPMTNEAYLLLSYPP